MVVILCDCIRHYVDNFYSDNWMAEKGIYDWDVLKEEDHMLSKIPISKMKLRKTPLFDSKATVGDVMSEMSNGV
jgi:hypothetical protein